MKLKIIENLQDENILYNGNISFLVDKIIFEYLIILKF